MITLAAAARTEQAGRVTILLHKPIGYVSGQAEDGYQPASVLITEATRWHDPRHPQTFSPAHLRGLAPAGRLDIDSTGLIVFTQDGRIAKELIGEDSRIEKEYLVRVEGRLSREGLALLNFGLSLDGEPLKPAKVSWQNEDQLRFVLRQGRKRQIRRMCELVGLAVTGLKRVRIGSVLLGSLPVGKWRYLRRRRALRLAGEDRRAAVRAARARAGATAAAARSGRPAAAGQGRCRVIPANRHDVEHRRAPREGDAASAPLVRPQTLGEEIANSLSPRLRPRCGDRGDADPAPRHGPAGLDGQRRRRQRVLGDDGAALPRVDALPRGARRARQAHAACASTTARSTSSSPAATRRSRSACSRAAGAGRCSAWSGRIAALGVALKAFDRLRIAWLSTGLYLVMGWLVLIAAVPLWRADAGAEG